MSKFNSLARYRSYRAFGNSPIEAITIELRNSYRNRRAVRDHLWLIALTAVATVAYLTFYATR